MRVCTFFAKRESESDARVGVVADGLVLEPKKKTTLLELLDGGPSRRKGLTDTDRKLELRVVRLMAPLPRPRKILATIVNTRGMLGGADITLDRPRVDMKATSTVVGPDAEVLAPLSGIRPEVELAAIIGRRITKAKPAEAAGSIFGFTVLNDVTAPSDSREDAYQAYRRDPSTGEIRKALMRGPLFRSKNHDTFCPMGPWIVTRDELGDTSKLNMNARFDGEVVQSGSTSEYLFSPQEIAAYVSSFLTLEPGDVVSCGSVGWSKEALGGRDPTEYLLPKRGGLMELEVSGIGRLRNRVVYA